MSNEEIEIVKTLLELINKVEIKKVNDSTIKKIELRFTITLSFKK